MMLEPLRSESRDISAGSRKPNLPEQLMSLAWDSEKNALRKSLKASIRFLLVGAVLKELELSHRVQISTNRVSLIDTMLFDNEPLDSALAMIASSARERSPRYWFYRITMKSGKIRDKVLRTLESMGLTANKRDKKKIEPDLMAETSDSEVDFPDLREEINKALLSDLMPDPRIMAIISLASRTKLLAEIIPREHHKAALRRAKELSRDDPVGKLVSELILIMQLIMGVGGAVGPMVYYMLR